MEPPGALRRGAVVGGMLLLVAVVMFPLHRSSPRLPTSQPRMDAVLVDGMLELDAAARVISVERCHAAGHPGPQRSWTLVPGDAIELAAACEAGARGRMPPDDIAALGLPVDVNTASLDELATLPGVGPAIAARIEAARPYAKLGDLLRVRGIGPARLAKLAARVRVRDGDDLGSPVVESN